MSLYDPPANPEDPRFVVAVVRIATLAPHRVADRVWTMSMNTHDVDPEYRTPMGLIAYLLDVTDEGKAAAKALADLAEAHLDPENPGWEFWATVTIDGACEFDGPGDQALADLAYGIGAAERAVVNP